MLINGQYDLRHNIKSNGNLQTGFAFEGNARLSGKKSPFQLFGTYSYYEPYSNFVNKTNQATMYERTVGEIAYKYNGNLTLAVGDSNLHYLNPTAAAAAGVVDDANAVSVWSLFSF